MTVTRLRRRATAVAWLALALAAAACGGGQTSAPEPAATTAAPTETTAAPTTAAPAPATTESQAERCASAGADLAEERAAEARDIMDAGPAGLGLQRLDDLRSRARLTATAQRYECTGGWTDADEERYQAIRAAAAETVEEAGPGPEPEPGTGDAAGPEPEGEQADAVGQEGEQAPAPPATTADPGPAPDDPEWVDELPEPADPDPEPVGAELVWPVDELRPVGAAWPFICDHQPYRCEPGGPWTRGPVALSVGARILEPGDPGLLNVQEFTVPDDNGIERRLRVTTYPPVYRYTVTGFAPEAAPGAGGLLNVRVLLHQTSERRELTEGVDDGWSDEQTTGGERNSSIWGTVLPEHADTVVYDADGNMTAATLVLFDAPPAAAGS